MSAILNLPSWIQPFWTKKNFTHSFWLNLMMAAILNSTILDSAILHKKKFTHSFLSLQLDDGSHLELLPCWIQPLPSWIQTPCYLLSRFTQKHSHSTLTLTQTNSILIQTHSFSLNLMMATILNSAMLNFAILDSAFLVFPLKLTHTCHWLGSDYLHKESFTHSFWLNLMMAAILNSAILDSATAILDWDTLLSSLRITQKYSHSTLTLTQTNSFSLDLDDGSHLEFCHLGFSHFAQKTLLIHSDSILMMAAIIQFYHLGFSHFAFRHFF